MKVAVLSDTHDNIWNVEKALKKLGDAQALIFCGDLCAPFTLKMLAEGIKGHVHCLLGNNDGDPLLLSTVAAKAGNVTLYQAAGELELDGKRLAFAHYPLVGKALAHSGLYDAVFSGHTHEGQSEIVGETLWANPGEVMGRLGEASFGLYDTATGAYEVIKL
jgi:putative phosphoesterase